MTRTRGAGRLEVCCRGGQSLRDVGVLSHLGIPDPRVDFVPHAQKVNARGVRGLLRRSGTPSGRVCIRGSAETVWHAQWEGTRSAETVWKAQCEVRGLPRRLERPDQVSSPEWGRSCRAGGQRAEGTRILGQPHHTVTRTSNGLSAGEYARLEHRNQEQVAELQSNPTRASQSQFTGKFTVYASLHSSIRRFDCEFEFDSHEWSCS